MKTITQEYATQYFSTNKLLLNFQADLALHVCRQKANPENPEFVNSLHYINGELRNTLFQLNQILPNEIDICGRFISGAVEKDVFDDLDVLSGDIEEVVIKGVRYKKVTETKTTWEKIS